MISIQVKRKHSKFEILSFTLCYFHYLATSELKFHTKQSGGACILPQHVFEKSHIISILPSNLKNSEICKH